MLDLEILRLRALAREQPNNAAWRFQLAVHLYRTGQWREAYTQFAKLQCLRPEDREIDRYLYKMGGKRSALRAVDLGLELGGIAAHLDLHLPLEIRHDKHCGQYLNAYRLIRLLQRQASRRVYKAYHHAEQRYVVVETFPLARCYTAPSWNRSLPSHPAMLRILDVGLMEGVPYRVSEYVMGENLSSILTRHGRLQHQVAVEIAEQLSAYLVMLWRYQRPAHTSLIPENILISLPGTVKIPAPCKFYHTRPPYAYIAPEALWNTRRIDFQANIYSLGAILYHMLTGHPPVTGGAQRLRSLMSLLQKDLVLPEGLPVPLLTVLCRMTARHRVQRYSNPLELCLALRRLKNTLRFS